jgi:iron only hydrogenase large subunit-like protein
MPVFINNVDDYLGPSQACVNPLFLPDAAPPSKKADLLSSDGNTNATNISLDKASPKNNNVGIQNNRSRVRQRRAPRIIQSDDTELLQSTTVARSADPVIRLEKNGEHEKNINVDNDTSTQLQLSSTTMNADIITTQTIQTKAKASVTLSDCLSCSGCVTSAEAVLMSHHSIDSLREASQLNSKRIVFTISPASLADLYRHLYLENEDGHNGDANSNDVMSQMHQPPTRNEFLSKITAFLVSEFGAEMVIDGILPQRISLVEAASEFCHRYRKTRQSMEPRSNNNDPVTRRPMIPSIALSSTKTRYINKHTNLNVDMDDGMSMEVITVIHPPGRQVEKETGAESMSALNNTNPASSIELNSLPMLSSSCPGFVCLVEKTAPLVVPLLSSAKSPMAVAGTLTKIGLDDCEKTPSGSTKSYFHVAIMPCHDKKLEAGRADFAWEKQVLLQYGNWSKIDHKMKTSLVAENDLVNEVDLVLTTGELLEALSDAITTQKNTEVSALTIHPTINSEADRTSKVDTIRKYLSQVNDGLDLLGVLKNVTNSNYQQDNETMSSLELDTGVHGSGSYADFIFRWAARELFDCELSSNTPLPWKSSSSTHTTSTTGQGSGLIRRRSRRQETTDMREVTLFEHNDGSYSCFDSASEDNVRTSQPVLHFATAYGFKNVQLILQSLSKTGLSSSSSRGYDYVEIMACPSGCSNGGGQIGANGHRETPRETKQRVNKTVSVMPIGRPLKGGCTTISDALIDCDIKGLVNDNAFIQDVECFNQIAKQLFHTRFHVVPSLELSTGATAGVALSDTKW